LKGELGLAAERFGDAVALRCRAVGSLLVNRTLGLGSDAPVTRELLREIVGSYAENSIEHFWIQPAACAEPPELDSWLEGIGLVRYRRPWDKFVRGPEPPPAIRTSLCIREVGPDDAAEFAGIFLRGFELPETLRPMFAAIVGWPRWTTFMAYAGDKPAAAAALYVNGRLASLAGAATLPEFRCRGAQSALMSVRISRAIAAGAEVIATETGALRAGEPNHSYRNMLRAGFRVAATRENYGPAGTTWQTAAAGQNNAASRRNAALTPSLPDAGADSARTRRPAAGAD
jgi:ribosomal protein S18 acetylase RimI-like enzyme